MKKFNANHRVSVERVVSGTGLFNVGEAFNEFRCICVMVSACVQVYEFLSKEMPDKVDRNLHREVSEGYYDIL